MSDDLLITPGSRKLEIKDSSGNVDAKIETDASGNLLITNAGGDISIGDTSSDVFIGDGTNNVDIVFEQDGEIRGTSGVTLTLGASGSNVRLATDLNLNSNDITNVNDLTITGNLTVNGTTTTVSSTNTTIADSLIELNSGLTGANTKDIGFIFERGSTGNNAAFFWDESSDRFRFITTTNTGSATSIADNISEGTIQAGSFIGNGSQLGSLNASNLSSGTVPSARLSLSASDIPNLAASKITSGTFADARIPNLAASKITSGTFADARIAASSITQHTDPKYLRSDTSDEITGTLTIDSGTSMGLRIEHDTFGQALEIHREDASNAASIKFSNNSGTSGVLFAIHSETDLYWRKGTGTTNHRIWHSGNDGSGTGLDADKLDNQQGSYYLDYNNFTNTPTIPTNNNQLTNGASYITASSSAVTNKLPLAGGTMSGDINMSNNDITAIKFLQFDNREITDFTGARQMLVDANDGDSDVPAHGDYAGSLPFGIYFTGDNDSATTTLGSGLVKVWHTGHFKKEHIDYFVGLKNTGVTTTEFDYLDGVTSNIQTQLNSKISGNQTITLSGDVSGSGTTSINVTVADDSHNHVISNVDGLQSALDGKLALSGGTLTGTLDLNNADSLSFEEGKHWITWNDGEGNFNIRVGHKSDSTPNEVSTETGYVFHDEWSQSSGWREFNISGSSITAGNDVGTWRRQMYYDYDVVNLAYQGSTKFATKSDGVDITGELQSDSLDVDGVANISGDVTTTGHYIADTHFRSSDSNATLSATGGGGVYLRPDGNSNSANQVVIASGTGNATFSGTISSGMQTITYTGSATPNDSATGLRVVDNRTAAANVGGSISLTGAYNGTTLLGASPYIRAYKANGSAGDYSFGLKFGIRKNGSGNTEQALQIDEDKNATFEGSITSTDGSGTFEISGDSSSNTYLIATGEIRVRPSGTSVNKLVIGSNGNITTAGTISSGAITSSGVVKATQYEPYSSTAAIDYKGFASRNLIQAVDGAAYYYGSDGSAYGIVIQGGHPICKSVKIGSVNAGTTVIDGSRRFYPVNIQSSGVISFLNGSNGSSGSGAQGINVRHIYAGTTYANSTAGAGEIESSSGFKVAGTTVIDASRNVTSPGLVLEGASNASYDAELKHRTVGNGQAQDSTVDLVQDIQLAYHPSSYIDLAANQTYSSATQVSQTFTASEANGTRWYAKVKTYDPQVANDPVVCVNNGTEHQIRYENAVNGQATDDSNVWTVVDITDDVVNGSNTIKVYLKSGQKTYFVALYVFSSAGLMLPNEPYELPVYSDQGFGVEDKLVITKGRVLQNISTSAQNSEATSLMIDSSGTVGTRELGSNAFNSTTIPTNNNQLTNGSGFITNTGNTSGTAGGLSGTPNISVGTATATAVKVEQTSPYIALKDTANAGGGGARGIITFGNTSGEAMGLGYTDNTSADSDFIISSNAGGTYGGYLGLDAAAITDAQSDIILEPKTHVRIATGSLKMGNTVFVNSSRAVTATTIAGTTGNFSETLTVDSANYAIVDNGSLGWSYSPQESSSANIRYFLMFNYTNNGSYPFLTNRTPSGRVSIFAGTAAGGGENEKIRVNGGDGTTEIDMFGTLDMNSNNQIGVGNLTFANNKALTLYTSAGDSGTGSVHLPRAGMISFYGNANADHSIASRNHAGNVTDDLRISSYGALYIDLDANSNNDSAADFVIGRHGSGTGTLDELFRISGENSTISMHDHQVISYPTTGGTLTIGDISNNDEITNVIIKSYGGTSQISLGDSEMTLTNDVYITENLRHSGDANTRMQFTGDRIRLYSGNVEMLDLVEGTTDYVDIIDRVRVTAGGDMICEGDIVAFTSTTVSDINQKENIKPIKDAVNKVGRLAGVTFDWKKDKEKSAGVIAQDVEKVLPEIVKDKEDRDGEKFKSVDYNGVIGLLVEGMKEQQNIINRLEDRIKDLENKNGD